MLDPLRPYRHITYLQWASKHDPALSGHSWVAAKKKYVQLKIERAQREEKWRLERLREKLFMIHFTRVVPRAAARRKELEGINKNI